MEQFKLILFIALAILISLFAVTNAQAITINLFFAQYDISTSLVILISVLLGAIMTMLFGLTKWYKTHARSRQAQRQIDALTKQVEATQAKINELTAANESLLAREANWKAKYEEEAKKPKAVMDETAMKSIL